MSKYQTTRKVVDTSTIYQRGKTQIPSKIRKALELCDGDILLWLIIDGEGTVRISRALKAWYAPFIQITNTDARLMEYLQHLLGDKGIGVVYHEADRRNPSHKPKHVYNIASVQGVKQVLTQIVPFLIIKRKQAELVLDFIAMKEEKADYGVLPREQEIFEELKRLNARGVGDGNA